MKPKLMAGIALLSLVITVLTFHVYIDGKPQPVVETFFDLTSDPDSSDQWSYDGTLTRLTPEDGRYRNPVWSPDGTTIAVECEGWIFLGDTDPQGAVRRLAEGFDPAFSPAGDEVLFVRPIKQSTRNPEWEDNGIEALAVNIQEGIVRCIARLENVEITRNSQGTECDYLVWSPSKQLAVLQVTPEPTSRYAPSCLAIWDIQNNTLKYADSVQQFWSPSWSPNEQELVFSGLSKDEVGPGRNPRPNLWFLDTTTWAATRLTATPDISELNPQWSPDGSKIVFASYANDSSRGFVNTLDRGGDICTINPDGTERNVLVNRSVPFPWAYHNEDVLAWHPASTSVTYFAWGLTAGSGNTAELSQELWTIGQVTHEPEGGLGASGFQCLIQAPLHNGILENISWSPTGDRISFEWTPCSITVQKASLSGIYLQFGSNLPQYKTIYILEIPGE